MYTLKSYVSTHLVIRLGAFVSLFITVANN